MGRLAFKARGHYHDFAANVNHPLLLFEGLIGEQRK